MTPRAPAEWPTLVLLVACYTLWAFSITWLAALALPLAIALAAVAVAFHSSLQHEAIHGHPTRNRAVNAALVWPALGLVIPYARFRDIHLAHHRDSRLTDPYDDPESNYLDPAVWSRLPAIVRALLRLNNTLLGRVVLGPLLGQIAFLRDDLARIRRGEASVRAAWAAHLPAAALVVLAVALSPMPLWAYALAVYAGLALIKIRTFLEHRAHEDSGGRTVVIEDRGPLALLFLNNNFHLVHHMHPTAPWYRLPGLYFADVERYLRRNHGYRYRSYADIVACHLLRAKDPVPHPLWPQPAAVPARLSRARRSPARGGPDAPAAPLLTGPALAPAEARTGGTAHP